MEEIILVNKFTGKIEAVFDKENNDLEEFLKFQLERYNRVTKEEYERKTEGS